MYIYIHIYICIRTYVRMYVCMYVCMYVFMYIYVYEYHTIRYCVIFELNPSREEFLYTLQWYRTVVICKTQSGSCLPRFCRSRGINSDPNSRVRARFCPKVTSILPIFFRAISVTRHHHNRTPQYYVLVDGKQSVWFVWEGVLDSPCPSVRPSVDDMVSGA